MFEVGFTEIILILGLALLVLGPEKLPGLAQKVGRWTGRARAMARQLRTQLEHEVTMEELAKSRPMQGPANDSEATAHTASSSSTSAPSTADPAPSAAGLDTGSTISADEPHAPMPDDASSEKDAAAANFKP